LWRGARRHASWASVLGTLRVLARVALGERRRTAAPSAAGASELDIADEAHQLALDHQLQVVLQLLDLLADHEQRRIHVPLQAPALIDRLHHQRALVTQFVAHLLEDIEEQGAIGVVGRLRHMRFWHKYGTRASSPTDDRKSPASLPSGA